MPITRAALLTLASLFIVCLVPRSPAALHPDGQTEPGYRLQILTGTGPAVRRSGFTRMDPDATHITFTNRLDEERSLTNQIFLNGSGVALGDVDGDGRCDIYLCGLDSPNALYRNLGNWRFEDITLTAGVACADQASTGAAFVDVDGDGDLDLLVNGIARGTRLFLNDGHGHFQEATASSGLQSTSGSTSFAVTDFDGDGRPDVYVVNYRSETMRDQPGIIFTVGVTNGTRKLLSVDGRAADSPGLEGRFTLENGGGILENGEADVLFRNLGGGRFEKVAWTQGAFLDERGQPATIPYDWGLSAMFHDLNGDGLPDLYVCNDFQSPDRVWMNDGLGHFRAVARAALRQTSLFSMGVDAADVDRDGHYDFFVADMLSREHVRRQVQVMNATAVLQSRNANDDRPQSSRNTLFRNRGNGTFAEIARLAGLEASDWTWCPVFLDVDLDGYEDLLATTGHWRDAQDADAAHELDLLLDKRKLPPREQLRARRRFPKLETKNFAFRNRGDLTFEEVGESWGFDSRRISQGMALADLDNDGDLDLVVNCLNEGPLLYRNDSTAPRIAVRLLGRDGNTRGIGAQIRVIVPGLQTQSQEMICGGRYLSSDDPMRTFAAGNDTNLATVEVHWRSGRQSVVHAVPANRLVEIAEPDASPASPPTPASVPPPPATPFFEDRSRVLGQQHVDAPFDEFTRQPLLPHALAQPGPAVAWYDFNGDGWEDLLIGAGRGGRIAVFRNDGQGGFIPQKAQMLQVPMDRDVTGLLCWRPGPDNLLLLAGLDRYEFPAGQSAPGLRQLSLVTGRSDDISLPGTESAGALAMGDFDGDGGLELFVGGRVIPGRYPEAASSSLLHNDGGHLVIDTNATRVLSRVGLVNGATFTDLDLDHRPELVLACEWGPLRIFRSEHGKPVEWNPPVRWFPGHGLPPIDTRLDALTGWWNSIAAGDFDGDGRIDLVAGNWGRNTSRNPTPDHPLRMSFSEIEGAGTLGLIESRFDLDLRKYVPTRDRMALGSVFPSLPASFPTYSAFARATVDDVLAAGLPPMREVRAVTLDSMVFLNRGETFEAHPLPLESQVAPVFGIAVADFDGNGTEDLVLAQNAFVVSPSESRLDAGYGTWLRGDGHGGFVAVPPLESGITVVGEGRGAAVCDFDHDGRPDLVIGQNRGISLLYRNALGRPCIRLVLRGRPENPQAIGATARVESKGGRPGPLHEIRLGGGYMSQDSSTLLLAAPDDAESILVQWPKGPTQRVAIPKGEMELEFTQPMDRP